MRKRGTIEGLEVRSLLTATIMEHDQIAYVFADAVPRVDRFDLAAESWLPPLQLDGVAGGINAATVTDKGIFASFGNSVYRFDLDGNNGAKSLETFPRIDGVFADENLVLVQTGSRFYSLDALTNHVIEFKDYPGFGGLMSAVSAEMNRLVGIGAYDLAFISYADDGRFLGQGNSTYQTALPVGSTVWSLPGGQELVTNSGTVFDTASVEYRNSFGTQIVDIDFDDVATPVIAFGQSLTRFDAKLFPTTSVDLNFAPARIFVQDDGVIALTPDVGQPSGFRAEIMPWSAFELIAPGAPLNPEGLQYTPDDWRVAADGTLLLFSKVNQSIFRWDPQSQRYTDSIRLLDDPYQFTYSRELNVLLVGYVSGRVTALDLNALNPVEKPVVTLPGPVLEIESLGADYFVTADPSFNLNHSVFTMDGVKVDSLHRANGVDFTWNKVRQKLYFFLPSTFEIAAEEINADGVSYPGLPPGNIGEQQRTAVGFQFAYQTPIHVADDGSFLVFRSRQVVDLATLELHTTFLTDWIEGAAWIGDELFTTRRLAERTQLQRWTNGSFVNDKAHFVDGEPLGLVRVSEDRLVAINLNEAQTPEFSVLNTELEEIPAPFAIEIAETHGKTVVHENGAGDSVGLALSDQPEANVVVRVGSLPAGIALSSDEFVFTPDNWNTPQSVTLSSISTGATGDWRNVRIRFEISAAESDSAYSASRPADLTVDVVDADAPAKTLAEYAGIVYVLSQSESRVDRFALGSESWLEPIAVGEALSGASAFHVDADGIFVAFGASLYRYELFGGDAQRTFTFDSAICDLHSDGNWLFAVNGNGTTVGFVDKPSNELRNLYGAYASTGGSSIAPTLNRVFGWKTTTSPQDIVYFEYSDVGTITSAKDSPYHGAEPTATRTWVFPDETKVVDNAGTVYSTSSLSRLGAIASGIDDVQFYATIFAILRVDRSLFAYTSDLQFIGGIELAEVPGGMFVNGEKLATFTMSSTAAHGYQIGIVPLSELRILPSDKVVDPVDLPFRPDLVEQEGDGTLLLLSKEHRALFRWDPATQRYVDTIPLLASPAYFAVSANARVAYVAYSMGLIYRIDLTAPDPSETYFASLTYPIGGMATADGYLYVASGVGRTGGHFVFGSNGSIVDASTRDTATAGFTWSESNQKMYFLRQNSGPNRISWDEINANGTAYPGQAPGAIRNRFTSSGEFSMAPPIRIRTDGQVGLLGSLQIFDARTLSFMGVLPNSVDDALWLGSDIFAIRNIGSMMEVQRISGETYELMQSLQLSGEGVAIRSLGNDRLIVIVRPPNSPPGFYVLDANFSTFKSLTGDTNFDGSVDLQDLNNVRNGFGEAGHGDADGDGDIDLEDLNAVRNSFGATTASLTRPASTVVRTWTSNISLSNPIALKRRDYADAQVTNAVDQIHEAEVVAWQWWREATDKSPADSSFTAHRKSRKSLII